MYEHELKFEVKDVKKLLEIFKQQKIEFYKEKHQIDSVWISNDADGLNFQPNQPFARIRHEGDKVKLTVKVRSSGGAFEEHEFEIKNVDDIPAVHGFFKTLGLRQLVEITKHRKYAKLGEFTLCLDNVKDLGDFLEIEFLSNQKDTNANKRILEKAKIFELNEKDLALPYDTLLCQKFNLR